jgi:hypothetical protein
MAARAAAESVTLVALSLLVEAAADVELIVLTVLAVELVSGA